jgi:hypothetical protein
MEERKEIEELKEQNKRLRRDMETMFELFDSRLRNMSSRIDIQRQLNELQDQHILNLRLALELVKPEDTQKVTVPMHG